MNLTTILTRSAALAALASLAACASKPATSKPPALTLAQAIAAEAPFLTHHVELTSRDQFVKAGEAYFSPDGEWIIFQAVPVPEAGKEADAFYSMFVAKLTRDAQGQVTGLAQITRVSAAGSANTCGWFHPTDPSRVLFGSTTTPPHDEHKAGFQVGTRKYVWMFPDEMDIVEWNPFKLWGEKDAHRRVGVTQVQPHPTPVVSRPNYDAECSYSNDGRYILYTHVEDMPPADPKADPKAPAPKADGNIYIYDTKTQQNHAIVTAPGYDGGPFFSPDNKSICYRSDREGNDLLQLFVADLRFEKDAAGDPIPVGIQREYQLTKGENVNWCPYWNPTGEYLVFGSSELSHANYEVFAIKVDRAKLADLAANTPAAHTVDATMMPHARVTHAAGADILPAFSADGTLMMWTAQRGPMAKGETKPSSQLWIAHVAGSPFDTPAKP